MLDAVNVKYEVSGSQSKTVRVYAYEIAAENQRLIETSVGEIDLDWNETSVRIDITDLKDAPLSKILNRIDSAAHIMNSLYPVIDNSEATHDESTNDISSPSEGTGKDEFVLSIDPADRVKVTSLFGYCWKEKKAQRMVLLGLMLIQREVNLLS